MEKFGKEMDMKHEDAKERSDFGVALRRISTLLTVLKHLVTPVTSFIETLFLGFTNNILLRLLTH